MIAAPFLDHQLVNETIPGDTNPCDYCGKARIPRNQSQPPTRPAHVGHYLERFLQSAYFTCKYGQKYLGQRPEYGSLSQAEALRHAVIIPFYQRVPGAGREAALRSLQIAGFSVTIIRDVTPIPHNGCRPPKRRRV